MNHFVNAVRDNVSAKCCTSRLRRGRCRIPIPDCMEPYCLVDMDHSEAPVMGNGSRCDFLFFGNGDLFSEDDKNLVVPLEFKRRNPKAKDVLKQLQAGSQVAESLLPKDVTGIKFQPVVVYEAQMNRYQVRVFRREKVRFREMASFAKLLKCGSSLAKLSRKPAN